MRPLLAAALVLLVLPSPARPQCGDPLTSAAVAATPAFQQGFSVVDASLADDTLCFRVQNRRIPRWVDVYVEGVTPDGKVVALGDGSLGPPETHLFLTLEDIQAWIDGTEDARGITIYPPVEQAPVTVTGFSRFKEVQVKCYGLSFRDPSNMSREDFVKFLLASSPTVVFEIAGSLVSAASGAKAPKVELRGRPKGDAMRTLVGELLADYRNVSSAQAEAMFRLYKSGDIAAFAGALGSDMIGKLQTVYTKNPRLVHDALVELGLDRARFPTADTLKKLFALDRLKDFTNGVYSLLQSSLAAALSDPILTFVIKGERPLPILYLIDTSGSMAEGGKMDQVRSSGIASLRQAASDTKDGGTTPVVEVLTFAGECSESSVRTALPFTADLDKALRIFESGLRPDGATPLPQAIQVAERRLAAYLDSHPEAAKGQLFVLSDGESTCGAVRPQGTYFSAPSSAGGRIGYQAVGFHLQPGSAAERDLQYLSSAHGGRYFSAGDQGQLARVFEKLVDAPEPKPRPAIADLPPLARIVFAGGVDAILRERFPAARKGMSAYVAAVEEDPAGHYNLALALEETDRYLGAADHYERYAALAPAAPDAGAARKKAQRMREDRGDHLAYQVRLLQSDLDYLRSYYESLFNRSNRELAAEFAGFVREKGASWAELPDALEIREPWLERAVRDLARGFDRIAARLGEPTFDRDAVSLLTVPIAQLEEIVERLKGSTAP